MIEEPYFFKNPKWYKLTVKDSIPVVELTEDAPEEARLSYDEYFKAKEARLSIKHYDEPGNINNSDEEISEYK